MACQTFLNGDVESILDTLVRARWEFAPEDRGRCSDGAFSSRWPDRFVSSDRTLFSNQWTTVTMAPMAALTAKRSMPAASVQRSNKACNMNIDRYF